MSDRRRLVTTSRRIAVGLGGLVVAGALVAGATALPLPTLETEPAGRLVDPVPVDQVRVCPGAVLRLSDEDGADATTSSAVGEAEVTSATSSGDESTQPLEGADAARSRPLVVTAPLEGDEVPAVSGAQSQAVDAGDVRGLAAAACAEPTSSTWLVGGSTRTGRVTLVTLANPTDVNSTVDLDVVAEQGTVQGPGIDGIVVAPRSQKVVPLAGFATGLSSPVVHVTSRGGQVVANLQETVVRTLQPGGVDIVGASEAPSTTQVVPGIVVRDPEQVGAVVEADEAADSGSVLRLYPTGDDAATVSVELADAEGTGSTFEVQVEAGRVTDVPVDGLAAGRYTAVLRSSVPVVAGVRTTTATAEGLVDLAWAASAPALEGTTQLTVPEGEGPALTLVNPGDEALTARLVRPDGGSEEVTVTSGGSVGVDVVPGETLTLEDADGLRAGVSLAGPGAIASWSVASPLPASTPVVVHP